MSRSKISLICTVKDDADGLEVLLESVANQTLQPDEVVIGLAESGPKTHQVLKNWKPKLPLKVIDVGDANRSQGRNKAVEASKGEILAFTDAGCRPSKIWLENLIQPFSSIETKLVSGLTLGEARSAWESVQVPFVLVAQKDHTSSPLPATRNMAMRRGTWLTVGGFAPHLTTAEDYEWSRRAARMGIESVFAQDAIVYWRPRPTVTGFWSMIFHLTRGDMQAKTWRFGHVSMLGRYVVFLTLLLIWAPLGIFAWVSYLLSKSLHTSDAHKTPFLYTLMAQILADTAVTLGILRGIWDNLIRKMQK